MKSVLLSTIVLIFCAAMGYSQEQNASVEKTIYGVQTGIIGVLGHAEIKLANALALRGELGLELGFSVGAGDDVFALIPSVILEPRYYYNLNRRLEKDKNISKNSGNFFALSTRYYPDSFVITNADNLEVQSTVAFIPKYGLKRTYWEHFTTEFGLGIGYYTVLKKEQRTTNDSNVAVDLHIRVGYTF